MENIALQTLQIFYINIFRAEIATTLGSKMVTNSTLNIENLPISQGYISVFSNISQPNFRTLPLLKGYF